jgi:ABC-type transport system involved in multi-copper enzyme maturation permease subunit
VNAISAIAWVTFRESLRQKLAVNLLVFSVLLILGTLTVSELTFGEQYRIIADLALTAAQLFGTLIAVFIGAALVAGDVQRRTLYPVISKAVSRTQYVTGRYAGLLVTLLSNLLVMAIATVLILAVYQGGLAFLYTTPLIAALLGLAAQLAVVGAVAIFFSSFTNTTLAAIFTLSVALAGHFNRDLIQFWRDNAILRVVGFVLPNLGALDYKVALVYRDAVPAAQLGWSLAYAALYATVALSLAAAIFARRDLR